MATIQRQGRPPGDHDQRRQDVAEAVWAVLRDKGLEGITLRAVAREGGFTTGVLSHYFQDKDELLHFSISHVFDQMDARWSAIIAANPPLEAIRQITAGILPSTEQSRLEWAAWLGFIARGPWSPAFADLRERRTTRIRAIIRQLIEKAIAAGEVDPSVDPADRADALVGFVEGMCIVNTSVDGKDLDGRRSQLVFDHLPLFLPAPLPKGEQPGPTRQHVQRR